MLFVEDQHPLLWTDVQAAWLGGLLDGEGCFWFRHYEIKGKRYSYPRVQLVMTDHDVVERAARLMGSKVHGPFQYKANRKPFWNTHVSKTTNAMWVMWRIYPYMGARRQEKIDELFFCVTGETAGEHVL